MEHDSIVFVIHSRSRVLRYGFRTVTFCCGTGNLFFNEFREIVCDDLEFGKRTLHRDFERIGNIFRDICSQGDLACSTKTVKVIVVSLMVALKRDAGEVVGSVVRVFIFVFQ